MKVFRYKYEDGIYAWDKIYELEDNMVDVMFLGSSHAFTSFDTGLLWRENGIASFVLGGPVQPMWNTYYVLREVLKTQTPKLIVLEGFSTVVEIQYQEDPYVIKNLYGMHWSRNKVKAILESTTKEHWKNLFLPWSEYHSRYTELDRSDFAENRGEPLYRDWKGYMCQPGFPALWRRHHLPMVRNSPPNALSARKPQRMIRQSMPGRLSVRKLRGWDSPARRLRPSNAIRLPPR